MDRQQEGVLTLIRSAVTGQALALPEDFDLDSSLPLLKRHQLTALACAGALNCGLVPGAQLFEGYGKSLKKSEDQLRILKKLFAAFDENGIAYLPLKGSNMKALYPRPELRVMGDADILIRLEQYAQIVPILESLGFEFQVESDHELIWHAKGLHLELHKRLIPSYNEDYYAYFGDGWRLAKKQAGCRYALSPEDDLIYQFTHFAKHYRDGGIGCRHVTDLWVYKRHFPNLDTAYIRRELDKLQLLAFYDNICRLVGVWFEGAPADQMTDFISEFIFESGSWKGPGSHDLRRGSEHPGGRFCVRGMASFRPAGPVPQPGKSVREISDIEESPLAAAGFLGGAVVQHLIIPTGCHSCPAEKMADRHPGRNRNLSASPALCRAGLLL